MIDTRVGEGTSVKVFLPRFEDIPEDRGEELVDAEPDLRTEAKAVILVVDDDEAVLRTTLRMLVAVGYETVSAATGRDALRLIADGVQVDLVLADLAMPEMTGAELAKAIHAKRPDLPVVIVTGYGGREVLRDFGEGKILQKPYAENELLEKIASALRQPPLETCDAAARKSSGF